MSEERYDILKLLGKGRTGGVYEAEDLRLGRKVAMRRFFSQNDLTDISEYEDEFKQIAQSLGALQHPNLLRVFDAGMDEDGAFIISQLLKGDTLHDRLKEGPLADWDVWDLSNQLLDAFSAAHEGGFVHGAITPGSIMMSPRARGGYLYVILDMGLSRLAPLIQGQDSILSMMADPAILAPELFDGSSATEKSDLYMLGNMIYMCLAGGHPFAGKTIEECAELHRKGLPSLTEYAPDTPQDFIDWIGDLCEVEPEHRPVSVVAALKSMPNVAKPSKIANTGNQSIVGATTIVPTTRLATPTEQQSTYGNQMSEMTATGPLTAGATLGSLPQTHGQLLSQYQAPKKSYKGLVIAMVSLSILSIILFFAMSSGGKKTGEQIASQKEKKVGKKRIENKNDAVAAKSSDVRTKGYPHEEILSFKLENGKFTTLGWNAKYQRQHRMTKDGWSITGKMKQTPGLSKRITTTDFEDMYKRGWSLKYLVSVREGEHVVGMQVSEEENEYWLKKNQSVSVILKIEAVGDNLIISSDGMNAKLVVNGVVNSFLTIEIRGKANDPTGSYQIFINGKEEKGYKGKMTKSSGNEAYADYLFSASGDLKSGQSNWVIRSLILSTGTPVE